MTDLTFTVPMVAPSVNHYKGRARNGHYFVKKAALDFKQMVAIYAKGAKVEGKRYQVDIVVFLGAGQKGDIDNFSKVCLDSLTAAGVIKSDAWVQALSMWKERDPENPRTKFRVRAL